jgi:hypothetical protein
LNLGQVADASCLNYFRYRDILRGYIDRMSDLDRIWSLVESDSYRTKLLEVCVTALCLRRVYPFCVYQLSSNLEIPEHDILHAVQADEEEIFNSVARVLSSEASERAVLDLPVDEAEKFMNLLYDVRFILFQVFPVARLNGLVVYVAENTG